MATLYRFNPLVSGTYSSPSGTRYVDFDMRSVPQLVALLPTVVTDAGTFVPQASLDKNVYVSTSTELKFNQPDIVEVAELPRLKVNNPRFKTRQRKGEIIMSDYRRCRVVGRVNVRLVRSVTRRFTEVFSNWGPVAVRLPKYSKAIIDYVKSLAPGVTYVDLSCSYQWSAEESKGLRYESLPISLPTTYPDKQDPASVVTSALAGALSTQMDVLTEIVELPSTVQFIQDKCTSVVNQYDKHAKRRRRAVRLAKKFNWPTPKLVDKLASLELQFRYAVMPMVYSIKDAGGLLEAYGYLFREARESQHFPVSFSDEFGDWKGNDKVSCLVKQRFDPDDVVARVHALIGPNPLATLWELTTLSFVVDWVVPIGDYITALTTPDMSAELKSSLAFRMSRYSRSENGSGLYREIYVEAYERQIINPRDHIGLRVSPNMNWKRWLDASSLSWSMARSKLKSIKGVRI